MGKMFAHIDTADTFWINIKCLPERAVELREKYSCVTPGYHMNKIHWNSVLIDGSVSESLLKEWIDHSYDLIVAGLPKKIQSELFSS
jgi:predicted DNA-binding protein (MmcQ/YjbR family)